MGVVWHTHTHTQVHSYEYALSHVTGWFATAQSVQRLAKAGLSGDRIPVPRFSAPVQTGPGAHPASYKMGTGSFPGLKRPGRGVDHPNHIATRLKKEESYTSTALLGLRRLL
jgi:hypothetical protein